MYEYLRRVWFMARSTRQSKILELISTYEVETQDDLVSRLKANRYNVTQATVSRDIKELGLIKLLSTETGKYKYAIADSQNQTSNKYLFMLRESIISFKAINNLVVVKTLKGIAQSVCNILDRFNLEQVLGIVAGIDTVLIILQDNLGAEYCEKKLENLINA